ncbi:MAG: phosphatase PAP2 family protein, partial [Chitinophagaceae bacterium]
MKLAVSLLVLFSLLATGVWAQSGRSAGQWKTWHIPSGASFRLPPPPDHRAEVATVLQQQAALDSSARRDIVFWNAGAPGYRWQELMGKLWTVDTTTKGVLANMLLATAIYDATVAAWNTKYAYKSLRPFETDKRVRALAPVTAAPAYPCEHSVAAGVAQTIIAHFYPRLADSAQHMAQRQMAARVAAGLAWPSDTRAGFALGQRVAEAAIARTRDYVPTTAWDGKRPEGPGVWQGKPMFPMAGKNHTMVLDSASEYRPGPPPDFTRDMAELKSYKQTFSSKANAFYFATQNFGGDLLFQKLFEYNEMQDPPQAARAIAAVAVATYDCFVACWDAKYTYWAQRPNQYDTTYQSLLPTPP